MNETRGGQADSAVPAFGAPPAPGQGLGEGAKGGVLGGLAGGVLFGAMMTMMGMFPTIARMAGSSDPLVGMALHVLISAVIGLIFGLLFASRLRGVRAGVLLGAAYGAVWWVLGALIIMPLLLGMPVQLAQALSPGNLLSLVGHLIYGAVLGGLHVRFFSIRTGWL